jgi:hypothetical protein
MPLPAQRINSIGERNKTLRGIVSFWFHFLAYGAGF